MNFLKIFRILVHLLPSLPPPPFPYNSKELFPKDYVKFLENRIKELGDEIIKLEEEIKNLKRELNIERYGGFHDVSDLYEEYPE